MMRVIWIAICLTATIGVSRAAASGQQGSANTPELAPLLDAAGAYVAQYEQAIAAVVAQEDYQQVVRGVSGSGTTASRYAVDAAVARKTRADLLVLDVGQPGWVAFRDVYQVDGRAVRDHDERLAKLFADFQPDSMEQARRIAAESARYNLNAGAFAINRTINTPMTALLFLRAANQPRSAFRIDKTERVSGVSCVVVRFTEQASPRLIGTRDGSAARGAFWIDPATGRVLRTELELRSVIDRSGRFLNAKLRVAFEDVPKAALWLPAEMDETYEIRPGSEVIIGHAEYSAYRKFDVSTDEAVR